MVGVGSSSLLGRTILIIQINKDSEPLFILIKHTFFKHHICLDCDFVFPYFVAQPTFN